MTIRDYDADDLDDDDEWDEDPDDELTDECPHCRASIHDDSERCPNCGRYLSREDAPRRHPWWVTAGAVACLAVVGWWVVWFF
jgi:hypothetical protein